MVRNILLQSFLFAVVFSLSGQTIPDGYYDEADGLTGPELKSKLHQIIRNHTVRGYSEFRDTILPDLDEDPNNSNNIILFYKNNSIPKSDFASNNQSDFWNREHTWPSSHGFSDNTDTAYTDVHNLRPSDATVNSSKSNKDFDDIENSADNAQGEAPDTYTNSDFWEPRDNIKGDVARILLYMDVRYNSQRLDLEVLDRITFSNNPEIGVLYTLLRWHNDDPVDDYEANRHNKAFSYQNNRNPFVDHPEYVDSIWGDILSPLLTQNLTNFSADFGTVTFGGQKTQVYTLRGYNLEGDITLSCDEPFSISSNGTDFFQQVTLTNDPSNSAQDFSITVKFEPLAANGLTYTSSLIHSSLNASNLEMQISGKEGEFDIITIQEARAKSLGSEVKIVGVVVDKGNNSSNSRVIYDGTAGIVVRSFDVNNESSSLNYGDSILVTGGLSEFNNLLQVEESPITIELLKENAKQPEPLLITIADVGENLESQLVTIKNIEFDDAGGVFVGGGAEGNFSISDGTGSTIFRVGSSSHPLAGTDIGDGKFTITGFISQFGTDYQVSVRDLDDIITSDGGGGGSFGLITIAEARNISLKSTVILTGVILGGENNDQHNRILFDGTAGIVVRSLEVDNESANLQMGDSITIQGGIDDYFGTLQLSEGPISIEIHSQSNILPEPQLLNALFDLNEDYESELVRIEGIAIQDASGTFEGGGSNGTYTLMKNQENGVMVIGSSSHPLTAIDVPTAMFSLTGYVSEFNDNYRISPRTLEDIVLDPLSISNIVYYDFYPNPVHTQLRLTDFGSVENIEVYDMFGKRVLTLDNVSANVDMSALRAGFYVVNIKADGKYFIGKIYKK